MKRSIAILSAIIAVIMIASTMVACTDTPAETTPAGTKEKTPAETTQSTPGTGDTSDESSDNTETPVDSSESIPTTESSEETSTKEDIVVEMPIPVELDREMSIFVGELHYEEWLDSDDGDIVNTELYNRVLRVEENLGIDLSTTRISGTGAYRTEVVSEIMKYTESTDPNFRVDLCSCYSMWAGTLTLEGRYLNIAASDKVNFDMPYWPVDIVNGLSIDDKIYNVSGDISPSLLWETYCIYFNIDLIEQYNVPNPINLVVNKEWTLDKVIELTSEIYADDNKEMSGPSIGDIFGFTFSDQAHIKAFPFAMGFRVLETDDDAGYVLSDLYIGEKTSTMVDTVRNWINNSNGVGVGGKIPGVSYGSSFQRNQALFNVGNFAFSKYYLSGTGVNFGVVPCPLYDSEQEAYLSYYGNPSAFWGVPVNVMSLDDSCALLESLAADAYLCISPAIFERALKLKYTPNDMSGQSRMFDIIRDGLVFDACMLYNEKLTSYGRWEEIVTMTAPWSSMFDKFVTKAWDKQIQSIVTIVRNLP